MKNLTLDQRTLVIETYNSNPTEGLMLMKSMCDGETLSNVNKLINGSDDSEYCEKYVFNAFGFAKDGNDGNKLRLMTLKELFSRRTAVKG